MEPLGCNSPNGQHSAPDGQRSTQSYQDDSSGGRADKSAAVSLRACAGYDPLTIRRALDACVADLGGWSRVFEPGMRVLVKPNYLAARSADSAVVTHPRVVEAICRAVLEHGATPLVGDSTPIGSVHRVVKSSGAGPLLEALGVEVLDLNRGALYPATLGSQLPQLKIDPRVLEMDRVINLGKFKSHTQCVFTLSIKNMFGCVPGRTKAYWHFKVGPASPYPQGLPAHAHGDGGYIQTPCGGVGSVSSHSAASWTRVDDFSRMLIETVARIRPALNLVDAVVAMEGNGPMGGTPRPMGLIAGSLDPAALDSVLVSLTGLDPMELPVLRAAKELRFGECRLDRIPVVGDSLEDFLAPDFRQAQRAPVRFSLRHAIHGYIRQAWARVTGTATKTSALNPRK